MSDNVRAHVIALNEKRIRAWDAIQARLEEVAKRGDGMSSEDHEFLARANADIKALDEERNHYIEFETRAKESETIREAMGQQLGSDNAVQQTQRSEADQLRAWMRGEPGAGRELTINLQAAQATREAIRQGAGEAELRSLLWDTGSVASAVPTTTASSLYQYLEASIALMRMPTQKFPTSEGNPIKLPKLGAHAIATQVSGQGTALAGTDPSFLSMQLDAFKYGELLQVSSETVSDTTIDIIGFVTKNVARAVGRKIGVDFVVGSGSGAPMGVMTAAIAGNAGTIATGGSLITPTYENLVDLKFSINDAYRSDGNCAWLMNDLTVAKLVKLRDNALAAGTSGQVMWLPSPTQGIAGAQPDLLLGYPVYTDPNVASCASNAKIMAFGDWGAFYIRTVNDFVFERSDDYAFNTDLVTFRGKWRVDSDVIDTTALNLLKQSV